MSREAPGRSPPTLGEGRFLIIKPLGDGGTAAVYLCWDDRERQWCALKSLQKKFLDDEEMRRRFAQEAEALGMFHHPNIPRLIYHDPEGMPPFMVMELARNGSAMDWVRDHGPMPPLLAADLLFQVCQALDEAHRAGIVHRDVKPHNFLIDEDGVCKLTDFGIARWTDTTSLTATGSQIGTFSFMAPEQRSDTKSVDQRADVYSLGASLYTMLTSRTSAELFVAEDDDDLLAEVPTAFRDVVLKATRYRAEERYDSAVAFRNALMEASTAVATQHGDRPPLVRGGLDLPGRPPAMLPPGTEFPELEGLLEEGPPPPETPVASRGADSPGTRPQDMVAALGYRMPQRQSVRAPRREMEPEYIVSEDGAYFTLAQRDEITQNIAAQVRAEVQQALSEPAEEGQNNALRTVTAILLGLSGTIMIMLIGVVGIGTASVLLSAQSADVAAETLLQTVDVDANVVYELGGDESQLTDAYGAIVDSVGEDKLLAAVNYVDLLESSTEGQSLERSTERKLYRLLSARDRYQASIRSWAQTSGSFPGNVAIRLGLAAEPR